MGYSVEYLNPLLIKKQGICRHDIAKICALHDEREQIFATMYDLDPVADRERLLEFANAIEQIEFNLQKAWKFKQDREFHTWWYHLPHCSCEVATNYTSFRQDAIFDPNCPIHGTTNEQQ